LTLSSFACSGSSATPRSGASPLAVPEQSNSNATPAAAADVRDDWQDGGHDRFIEHDGLRRTFRIFIPERYDTTPLPLLLVFHGGAGDGDKMVRLGFDELADEHDFVVVYPDGIDSNWSDGRGTTDSELQGVDDVGFVRALLDTLQATVHIDPARVFATGASNGAMFSYRLGCELGDRIAAIAPVIGAMPSNLVESCGPAKPVSVISFHGTEDPFIPLEGGEVRHERFTRLGDGGLVESAEDTVNLWRDLGGCDAATEQELAPVLGADPTRVRLKLFDRCTTGVEIHSYEVEGMGHTWPGRDPALPRVSGTSTRQIEATPLIWAFFSTRGR
jgi:polyhydroxybutyrate depolymerase